MKNEDFLNLAYPPQWVAKILHLCISGAMQPNNSRGLKTELVYCIIPLIADDEVRKNLNRAISTSTFFSIFETKMKDRQEFLINFSKKYESFFNITNEGLIYLGHVEKIEFGDYLFTPLLRKPKKTKKTNDLEFERASFYLGNLLAKEEPRNVYLKLGMVPK
jgi:hypothetical protein